MIFSGRQAELTNWTRSTHSPCFLYQASNVTEIIRAQEAARKQHLSAISHGAGHSYTDAALNTNGVVIDLRPMHRILTWDAARGIMRVEAGATLRDVVQMAWKDGWWPFTAPSTSEVTLGGCTAMNVNGRNAWKWGPFGAHVISLDALLPSGEVCTFSPNRDPALFHAIVGSMGLLGIITTITIQLQRITSGYVRIRKRPAASLAQMIDLFAEEEQSSDFMEAWFDGFATDREFGRGILTCAALIHRLDEAMAPIPMPGISEHLETSLVRLAAGLGRPALLWGGRLANRVIYTWEGWSSKHIEERALFPYTFWSPAAFAGYQTLLPQGVETFQAFVPVEQARKIFERVLHYSQAQGCIPVWCIIKRHRNDPFLLSYQVDGFSLELNFPRTNPTAQKLKQVLETMIAMVIEVGGRFYLAKDHFLTQAQYRQSVGERSFDDFLELKQCYDPGMLLQSDLFRRIFQPALR
jgi:decaprenylphospho-beta-D-ribofuranose 2-oxidase